MRIRRKTAQIPPGSVVIDFDSTIADQRGNYQAEAKRRGYDLNLQQCNYNIIKQFIPGDILGEIDEVIMGSDMTRQAAPFEGVLDILREWSTQVIIATARSTDFQRPVFSWLSTHLPVFNPDQVMFYPSTASKARALTEFEIAVAIDDQLAPLKALPESTVRILFDPDEAFASNAVPGLEVVREWATIAPRLKSTVKRQL